MQRPFIILSAILVLTTAGVWADDNQKDWGSNYSTGDKLYNQNRLSEPYDNFDTTHKKSQADQNAEAYLSKIRETMDSEAKKASQERLALNFGKDTPESAISIAYPEKGRLKITLRANNLFVENSATLLNNSMDAINRVSELIHAKGVDRVELTIEDNLEAASNAKDLDADRSVLIFALLNLKKTDSPSS